MNRIKMMIPANKACRFVTRINQPISFFSSMVSNTDQPRTEKKKSILIIGCNGSLGRAMIKNAPSDVSLIGADVFPPLKENRFLDSFVKVTPDSVDELTSTLSQGIRSLQEKDESFRLDAVICTAGGWISDPPSTDDSSLTEYAESIEMMLQMNLYPAIAGGLISMKHLKQNGLFVAMGAASVLAGSSPNMSGYGMSKSALHHYIQTLGDAKANKSSCELMDKFASRTALGICPLVLDTPANREAMPRADWEKWVKVDDIARRVWVWTEDEDLRPTSGSLMKVFNKKDKGVVFQLAR